MFEIMETRIMGLSRSCIAWELDESKVHRDKNGKICPEYNPIIANCGTCLHNPGDNKLCQALSKALTMSQ